MGLAVDLKSSAPSWADSKSGNIYGSNYSGDFTVGSGQSMTWLFVVAGIVLVAWIALGRKK